MIASAYVPDSNLGSLRLTQIVDSQAGGIHHWNAFRWGPIGLLALLIYFICGLAETNRAPFDLPEAETELVAGYHTEYSSMKFGMFFLAEYANMVNVAAVATVLFLGGWRSPFEFFGDPVTMAGGGAYYSWVAALMGVLWFVTKLFLIMCIYIWLRSSLPRLRYDQLMSFAWKRLLPISLVLIMVVAIILTVFHPAPDAITMSPQADGSPVVQPLRGQ
jgi:NADH-quinone oxidoreductase subunit H